MLPGQRLVPEDPTITACLQQCLHFLDNSHRICQARHLTVIVSPRQRLNHVFALLMPCCMTMPVQIIQDHVSRPARMLCQSAVACHVQSDLVCKHILPGTETTHIWLCNAASTSMSGCSDCKAVIKFFTASKRLVATKDGRIDTKCILTCQGLQSSWHTARQLQTAGHRRLSPGRT